LFEYRLVPVLVGDVVGDYREVGLIDEIQQVFLGIQELPGSS
jgi:hypothetical protein